MVHDIDTILGVLNEAGYDNARVTRSQRFRAYEIDLGNATFMICDSPGGLDGEVRVRVLLRDGKWGWWGRYIDAVAAAQGIVTYMARVWPAIKKRYCDPSECPDGECEDCSPAWAIEGRCECCGKELPPDTPKATCGHRVCPDCVHEDDYGTTVCERCLLHYDWWFGEDDRFVKWKE